MAVVTMVEVRDPVAHVEYLKDEIQVLKARVITLDPSNYKQPCQF